MRRIEVRGEHGIRRRGLKHVLEAELRHRSPASAIAGARDITAGLQRRSSRNGHVGR
jgi:hypothetical protein